MNEKLRLSRGREWPLACSLTLSIQLPARILANQKQERESRRRMLCYFLWFSTKWLVEGLPEKTSRAADQALNGRCGIQIGLWENIWCVRSRGLMMLFEFLLPWQISAGLLVALPNVSGRYVASQKRCSSYSLSVWGCVFQRWKYCPSQAPWLLQRQVLCTWTRGELCGLPRWPHCQWLAGQNSKGEQRCSGCCRCCCSGDLRGPMPQTPKCQQNCCEPSLCRRSAGYLGIGSYLRDAFCAKLFGKI